MTRLELETIASLRERKSELMDDLIRRAIAQNPDIADKLIDANGVIVPPCKAGERLWVLDTDGRPREMVLDKPDIRCICAKEDNLCMATCDRPKTGICAYR